ncbi:MAG: M3 family metallopeptidase [Akkermansia sp.]
MFRQSLPILLLAISCILSPADAAIWNNWGTKGTTPSSAVTSRADAATLNAIPDFPSWPDFTPQSALAEQRAAVDKAKAKITQLVTMPESEMTFETIYRPYDQIMGDYADATNHLGFIHLVRDLDEWVQPSQDIAKSDRDFLAWIGQNEELKNALITAGEHEPETALSDGDQYYVYTTLLQLVEAGADLDSADKARLDEIQHQLSDAENEYDSNIIEAGNECYVLVTKDEKHLLDGISDEAIEDAKQRAIEEKKGSLFKPAWLFLADYGLLAQAEQSDMRERIWRQLDQVATQAPYDNAPLLDKILSLRQEMAQMLDYKSFADLEADKTMLSDSQNAIDIVDVIHQLAMPPYQAFMAQLKRYITQQSGKYQISIKPWDTFYYLIKRDQENNKFDQYEFCQYYPYEHVRDYCLDYFGRLFGLRIQEVPSQYAPIGSGKAIAQGSISVWDPRVQVYSVFDRDSNRYLGSFYLDAFERAEKSSGAWAYSIRNKPRLKALILNIAPSGEDGPDVLAGAEIHEFVHELGHVLHFIMNETELSQQSADRCAQDFIETPSQLLEQWLYDRSFLKALSKHVSTGKQIPDKLIDAYIANRDNCSQIDDIAHLQEVKLDLEMHLNYKSKFQGKKLNDASKQILQGWDVVLSTACNSPAYRMSSSISGGYRAKYYSYLWSHLLVSDIFSVFQQKGLDNSKLGRQLREKVYSKGASMPPIFLVEDFLGREIEPDPYFKHKGYTD